MSKVILTFREPINLINNLTTNISGVGALDAIIGKLLDDKINNAKTGMLPCVYIAYKADNKVDAIDRIDNPTRNFNESWNFPYCIALDDHIGGCPYPASTLFLGYTYISDEFGVQLKLAHYTTPQYRSKGDRVWSPWKNLGGGGIAICMAA